MAEKKLTAAVDNDTIQVNGAGMLYVASSGTGGGDSWTDVSGTVNSSWTRISYLSTDENMMVVLLSLSSKYLEDELEDLNGKSRMYFGAPSIAGSGVTNNFAGTLVCNIPGIFCTIDQAGNTYLFADDTGRIDWWLDNVGMSLYVEGILVRG